MNGPVFIGDELTATGFRLGGARVLIAEDSEFETALNNAAEHTQPILLSARCARLLPPDILEAALRKLQPAVVIVPDAAGIAPPDVRKFVRRTLDLE